MDLISRTAVNKDDGKIGTEHQIDKQAVLLFLQTGFPLFLPNGTYKLKKIPQHDDSLVDLPPALSYDKAILTQLICERETQP